MAHPFPARSGSSVKWHQPAAAAARAARTGRAADPGRTRAAVPALGEMDPERCYLAWDMVLTTAAAPDAIRDVFIFVEDECELSIEPPTDHGRRTGFGSTCDRRRTSGVRRGAARPRRRPPRQHLQHPGVGRKLDQLVNLVGELVTVQARLSEVAGAPGRSGSSGGIGGGRPADRGAAGKLDEHPHAAAARHLRAFPPAGARPRHRSLDKQVELTIEGAETELDKTVIDQLNDPLVHLIRNSMDHGIETPEARRAAGKPPTGDASICRRSTPGANVLIRVSDDGRGLDVEAVRARAIEQGLIARRTPSFPKPRSSPSSWRRVFHRARGYRCFRARRGNGRGAAQRGGSARVARDRQHAGRRGDRDACGCRLPWPSSTGCWSGWAEPISCCRWPTAWNASN